MVPPLLRKSGPAPWGCRRARRACRGGRPPFHGRVLSSNLNQADGRIDLETLEARLASAPCFNSSREGGQIDAETPELRDTKAPSFKLTRAGGPPGGNANQPSPALIEQGSVAGAVEPVAGIWLNLAVVAVVVVTGLFTTGTRGGAYPEWAPSGTPGMTAGFLLQFGWPALPGAVLGAVLKPLLFGESVAVSAAIALSSVAGGATCAGLLRNTTAPTQLFGEWRSIQRFIGLVAPAAAAVVLAIRIPALGALGRESLVSPAQRLVLDFPGALLQIVLGVPFVLACVPEREALAPLSIGRRAEGSALVLAAALMVAVASRIPPGSPWAPLHSLVIFAFVMLVAIAFRFGWRWLAIANVLLVGLVYGPTAQGLGPFGGVAAGSRPLAGVLTALSLTFASFGILSLACRQRETERSLERAVLAAEQASAAKSEFLATISHEIRTPLNVLSMGVDLLLESPLDAQEVGVARSVQRASVALKALIGNTLDLALVEQGQLALARENVRLRAILEDVRAILDLEVARRGLRFDLEVDTSIDVDLIGDTARLRQILLNLSTNAVKFTEEGSIVLRAGLRADASGHDVVRVEVEDTGIGVPEDQREQIFEAFWQQRDPGGQSRQGVGLGLSITRKLVELMGGRIAVTGRPGNGSCFVVTLPLDLASAAAPAVGPNGSVG